MIGAMQDITERKNVEEENRLLIEENNRNKNIQLNEAKNMYRLLADNTVDLVSLHSLDTTYEYLSPSIMNLMGFMPEELVGKSPLEYIHPDDLEQVINSYSEFITEENYKNPYVQARFRNKKGEYIWFEVKATIVKENGNPVGFQTSARNISQQKEVQFAMKKALAQERELNELRTNLVSTISHEFRTPMTTIRASAELIEMYIEGHDFVNSPQLKKRINTITQEIDRIVELMNAVLTISKDDAGKTNFNPIVIDLKQICIDVIETSFTHKMGDLKVKTIFEGERFEVFADKNLMEYSLFNLFNNAFKYSRGKKDILLNLSSNSTSLIIQITDFGIGIPEKDVPKLFNTFFRASNTEGIQGTGLGLYIVKTFTERNFGTISVQSILGSGTTVTLEFPLYNP
jgi:PAS domain S-box-containing protein